MLIAIRQQNMLNATAASDAVLPLVQGLCRGRGMW